MAGELSSVPGLKAKHLVVLTGPLHITTARDLARADRRAVRAAMRRLRPVPTLEEIATWQDHARDLAEAPSEPARGGTGWEQVAAFVVSFELREEDGGAQRRLVVEQVEQSPPEPREEWPAWRCDAACTWMLDRLGGAGAGAAIAPQAGEPGGHVTDAAQPAAQPAAGPAAGSRPAISVAALEWVSPSGRADRLDVDTPALDVRPGARLRLTAETAGEVPLQVALRVRRPGRPSASPNPPVAARSGEAVDIALDGVPPGEHAGVLAVWSPGGAAAPLVVPLPLLRVAETA